MKAKMWIQLILGLVISGSALAETAHQAVQLRASKNKDFLLRFKVDKLIEGINQEEDEGVRDPFWPVGYRPESGEPAPVVEEVVAAPVDVGLTDEDRAIITSKLKTTGLIKRGSRKLAVVNNQLVGVGDVVKVAHKGETYEFKVSGFNNGNVVVDTKWEETQSTQEKEQEENNEAEAGKS